MNTSVSQIKLYGPGIPLALKKLEQFAAQIMIGEYDTKITVAKLYVGEKADYEFIWDGIPTIEETLSFIEQLDKLILECDPTRYTITSRKPEEEPLISSFNSSEVKGIAYTFLRLYGPSISRAVRLLNEKITKRIEGIKSTTGLLIGTQDYAIEWLHIPVVNDIIILLEEIDNVIKGTGCTYKVSTKSKLKTHSEPTDKLKSEQTLQINSPPPVISAETNTKSED